MNGLNGVRSVGIGEYVVSQDVNDEIKTYGLGSCIAVMVYDWRRQKGALLHVAYPESSVNPERAKTQPGYFADTGVELLMKVFTRNHSPNRRDLIFRLAGGANVMDEEGRFNIGKRNTLAVKRELWRLGCGVKSEDVGGNISRTISLSVASGTVIVSNAGDKWEL